MARPTGVGDSKVLTENDRRTITVAVVLVVFAAAVALSYSPTGASSSGYHSGCSGYTGSAQFQCVVSASISSKNISACTSTYTGTDLQDCIYAVATGAGRASLCSQLESQGSLQQGCYADVAQSTANASVCNYVSQKTAAQCIYSSLKAGNFASDAQCAYIINGTSRSVCENAYYYNNAAIDRDASLCGYLPNTTNTTQIFYAAPNASIEYVQNSSITLRDLCYIQLSGEENSTAPCQQLGGKFAAACEKSVLASGISSIRFNVSTQTANEVCGAYSSPNASLCDYYYYSKAAIVQNSVSLCGNLNASFSSLCVLTLATNKSNSTYCNYVENSSLSSLCFAVTGAR